MKPTAAELLQEALRYASVGWPVFPCRPNRDDCPDPTRCECKAPLTLNGFKDASTDPAVIRRWWSRWPDANVAIATGAPGPDVLDVDVKPDGNGFGALNRLKRAGLVTGAARLIRTRSGGIHVYLAGTAQGCHSLKRHHLDYRSRGGYVIAPPSRIHDCPYELVDRRDAAGRLDWAAVVQLLDPPRPRQASTARWDGEDLPPSVQRALTADATDRSVALHRLVGACLRAGMDQDSIHELAASYQPALEKYGARLGAEVERSMRRIGA
jgi:Bifunctional DNA primase/polymerase, N-terminal